MRADEFFARLNSDHPEILAVAHEVEPPYILALNVIQMRGRRGMTQAQLADAIGVAQPRIAEIEGGRSNPRLLTLSKVAHALGVTLSELLENRLDAAVAASHAPEEIETPRKRRAG
ncbi:MAG TPA: helix-turn-helix transcriptional regulator [Longimicrobium sp.]|jgi:transcriptional regulator with XRE-family HTH domain